MRVNYPRPKNLSFRGPSDSKAPMGIMGLVYHIQGLIKLFLIFPRFLLYNYLHMLRFFIQRIWSYLSFVVATLWFFEDKLHCKCCIVCSYDINKTFFLEMKYSKHKQVSSQYWCCYISLKFVLGNKISNVQCLSIRTNFYGFYEVN